MVFNSKCLVCSSMRVQFFLLMAFSAIVSSQINVTYLPGFDGELPFKLETGYVGVGDANESQLFYLFVESQRSPTQDPLVLWLTGGPGCSTLSAFLYESGPVEFDYVDYDGGLPSLKLNPYTWTQGLNIIYVDAPVGTGFSYSTTPENYYIDDEENANQTYQFLKRWLIAHPQFVTNILVIGGDSYSGIPLPIVVQNVINGNEAGDEPFLNIKAYVLGNPKTDDFLDDNSKIEFAHRLALIPDELYKSLNESCNGNYVHVNSSNTPCLVDIRHYNQAIIHLNRMHVLEPLCLQAHPKPDGRSHYDETEFDFLALKLNSTLWCRDYNYVLSAVWANDKSVQEALNVRENTTGVWKRCNSTLAYTKTVPSSLDYHRNLTSSNLHALIYSGDHDISVTHVGTEKWIRSLNLTKWESWRPWYVDGQISGYTEKLVNDDFSLIYATVKGAGHIAPEYKAKECYEMISRWMAYYPL